MIISDTIFFAPDIRSNLQLPPQESQHCVKVLRKNAGDEIIVTDGKGSIFKCLLIEAHTKHCFINIISEEVSPKKRDYNINIAFAPAKQMDRNEWFVEKATEIGVDRIIPILTDFSERKEIKIDRLQKIAVSAMKQSQQFHLPEISDIIKFKDFVSDQFDGEKYIAHCYESPKKPLAQLYNKSKNTLLLIGPEGDFSESEVNEANSKGFESISLGETRLRTETACLVAVHTIHVLNNR